MSFRRLSRLTPYVIVILTSFTLLCVNNICVAQEAGADSVAMPVTETATQAQHLQPLGADDVDGSAVAASEPARGINFLALLMRGGWFMVPLLLMSIAVVFIGVERWLALRRVNVFPEKLVRQISLLSSSPGGLDPRMTYQICQRNPSSAARVIRSMLIKVGRPQSELELAVSESSQREATRLAQMVSWLSLAAAVAPLIGLLGTVWGITQAFYDTTQLVDGQNRAEALAQGIYTALVTTMCGLLIAIPAAVLAHLFENRIVRMINEIEEMIFNLMPQLERYEGKLRFSVDDAIESESVAVAVGDSDAVEGAVGDELPSPLPRVRKNRPNVPK